MNTTTTTDCTIRIGDRPPMRAKFLRWLRHYRASVLVNGQRWTVNALAIEFDPVR